MRKLAQMVVQPVFIDVDDDGEVTAGPYGLTNEQGQNIQFAIPAKEWKEGWDWQTAIDNVLSQLDASNNGVPLESRAARRRKAAAKKPSKPQP